MKKAILSVAMVAGLMVGVEQAQATVIQYRADLTGTSTSAGTSGTGAALLSYDDILHFMRVEVTFDNLTGPSTVSHIHCCTAAANTGTTGAAMDVPTLPGFPSGVTSGSYDVTFDLSDIATFSPAFVLASGGTAASAEVMLLAGLADGRAYLNVHSTYAPAGEISGFFREVPAPTPIALLGVALLAFGMTRRTR